MRLCFVTPCTGFNLSHDGGNPLICAICRNHWNAHSTSVAIPYIPIRAVEAANGICAIATMHPVPPDAIPTILVGVHPTINCHCIVSIPISEVVRTDVPTNVEYRTPICLGVHPESTTHLTYVSPLPVPVRAVATVGAVNK